MSEPVFTHTALGYLAITDGDIDFIAGHGIIEGFMMVMRRVADVLNEFAPGGYKILRVGIVEDGRIEFEFMLSGSDYERLRSEWMETTREGKP